MGAGEIAALIALLRLARRPPSEYAELVEQAGSAGAVLDAELAQDGAQVNLLPEDPEPMLREARADMERWSTEGLRLLTVLDDDYPQNLRQVHDRPPLLFLSGRLEPTDARSVAVIGSRRASAEGRLTAERFAASLIGAGFTIVSGLAQGVDTAAHTSALAAGGRTVAVVGTGLSHCYPPENAGLQQRVVAHGAVVSQFWPETPPTRHTFPLRNAVMSGLALGTVIIEASVRSGARVQARRALAHGRPVFLLRRLLGENWVDELASRPGVHVVDEPADIVETVERLNSTDALLE
jgi:DNA processing protein